MSGIFDQVINYSPSSLLLGTVTYKGTWSAATNTPTLVNPTDSTTNGHYYVVSAGGTQFSLVFNIGDWIISNGSAWEKVDNTDAVSSVFGRTGAVVGVSTDYSSVGINSTTLGATTPSTGAFTTLNATGAVTGGDAVFGNIAGERTLSVSATDRPLTMYSNSTADPALYWKTGSALRFGATTNGISSAGFSQYGVITATGLNSIAIGATTVSTGAFSTLSATGNTGIGTTSPSAKLEVSVGDGGALLQLSRTGASPTSLQLNFGSARPNIVYSDGAILTISDLATDTAQKDLRLGLGHYTNSEEPMGLIFGASGATTNVLSIGGGASILNAATEVAIFAAANNTTVTGTQVASFTTTKLGVLQTTASTSTTTGALTVAGGVGIAGAAYIGGALNLTGNVGVGVASNVFTKVYTGGNSTGSSSTFGDWIAPTIQSDVTANYVGVYSNPSTAAAVFTLGNLKHFAASPATLGAGSIITTQAGFEASSGLTTATNNYGFRGAIAAGSGRYNLYMDGTAQNYLTGNTGVGVAPSSFVKLNISGDAGYSGGTTVGISSSPTIVSASATTRGATYDAYFGLTGSSTVPSVGNFRANGGSNASGTITNFYGFWADTKPAGTVTNMWAFYSGWSAGTGVYNLYMGGSAQNYLAGNTGIGTASPNANALLDVSSTTKAFMPPRMTTTQKNAIASPTAGMLVYDNTLNKLSVYTTAWETVTSV